MKALIASGNNLFKKTSQAFTNGNSKFKLRFSTYNNPSDIAPARTGLPDTNGIISIQFNLANVNNTTAIDLATIILHETIHAELHRIKLSGNAGPNALPVNLYNWFLDMWSYYQAINSTQFSDPFNVLNKTASDAEHNLMAFHYINPIAQALREFDNNSHPVENYKYYAWDGLDTYGKTAGYITNQQLSNLASLSVLVRDDNHKNTCD